MIDAKRAPQQFAVCVCWRHPRSTGEQRDLGPCNVHQGNQLPDAMLSQPRERLPNGSEPPRAPPGWLDKNVDAPAIDERPIYGKPAVFAHQENDLIVFGNAGEVDRLKTRRAYKRAHRRIVHYGIDGIGIMGA